MPTNGIPIKTTYAALYSLLQGVPLPSNIGAKLVPAVPPATQPTYTWQRSSRRTIDWDQVSAADQPFMLLHAGPIEAEQKSVMGLPIYAMKAYCWIFFRWESALVDGLTPDDFVHDIFDAVNNTLLGTGTAVGERQTLGGTTYMAYPEGCVFESAIEDNQVLMFIPIIIRTGV